MDKQKNLNVNSLKSFFSSPIVLVIFGLLLAGIFGRFFAFTGFNVVDVAETLVEEVIPDDVGEEPIDEEPVDEIVGEPVDEETEPDETETSGGSEEENVTLDEPINETTIDDPIINDTIINDTIINETIINETVINETIINETIINETIINETIINETIINETIINETIINETIINETIINETIINETIINETIINETVINETIINETIINETGKTIETLYSNVTINQPVMWKKRIKLDEAIFNLTISLPKEASNLSVVKIENYTEIDIDIEDENYTEVEIDIDNIYVKDENDLVRPIETTSLITGGAVFNVQTIYYDILSFLKDFFSGGITGYTILEEQEDSIDLIIDEKVKEVEVRYSLPGPTTTEINISDYKKQIIVSSEYHYENVLAYTEIKDSPLEAVRLYWITNNSRIEVGCNKYDTDENGLVDYVEWLVPSLSNQTYEISIVVLNPYSYLRDGDTWYVRFNTTGEANLTIWSNNSYWEEIQTDINSTIDEMRFLNLTCGSELLSNSLQIIDAENNSYDYLNISPNDSVKPVKFFIENYSCNSTGEFVNYMNIAGYATLVFEFANQNMTVVDYAYDPSNCPGYDDGDYCWIAGTSGDTCVDTCEGKSSTCVAENWNDDRRCAILEELGFDCSTCGSAAQAYYPGHDPEQCYYRTGVAQDCRASNVNVERGCACVRNDFLDPPQGNKFEVNNISGDTVASIDEIGAMFIRGTLSEKQSSLNPGPNSFILENKTEVVIAYIDSDGNLFLRGTVTENATMSVSGHNLEFRNSTNDLVAFFDYGGNLKLKEVLAKEYDNP